MPFYIWEQNNSGGHFYEDDKLTHRVVIEADTYQEAEQKAFSFGVYYNGVEDYRDCECCGDRWYGGDELTVPNEYKSQDYGYGFSPKWHKYEQVDKKNRNLKFDDIFDYLQFLTNNYGWLSPDARVFFKDGTVKEFYKDNK